MADLKPLKDNDFEFRLGISTGSEQPMLWFLTDARSKINYYALVNDFYYRFDIPSII